MTHYRKMMEPREYIYCEDLQGRDVTVTIERVSQGLLVGEKGRKTKKPLAYFKGKSKPLALNITNSKVLERIAGSPEVERWVGLTIVLFPTTTKDKDGVIVPCVRIRPSAGKASDAKADPPEQQQPPPDDERQPGDDT